jgi:hypothetical protein
MQSKTTNLNLQEKEFPLNCPTKQTISQDVLDKKTKQKLNSLAANQHQAQ